MLIDLIEASQGPGAFKLFLAVSLAGTGPEKKEHSRTFKLFRSFPRLMLIDLI